MNVFIWFIIVLKFKISNFAYTSIDPDKVMSNAHEVWSTQSQSVIDWSYKRDDGEKTRIKLIHLMQNHEILDPAVWRCSTSVFGSQSHNCLIFLISGILMDNVVFTRACVYKSVKSFLLNLVSYAVIMLSDETSLMLLLPLMNMASFLR